ncbi:hypothetical protein A9K97_gp041 [Tokyovirus A1]|uniref:hypothetical protein n=1 Tax=Tokyovirus A1 TaxID=1826170 RepID=UPI0007A969DB|nr:hypothetical protein A9K97_gp041 [Tokyovirus A1]BAU80310.1 hypothetical protein [Tokyovirus A1]
MSSAEFFSLLPQEFISELFFDYYELCRTTNVLMSPLTSRRERAAMVFFLEFLLRSSPEKEQDKELIETIKNLDVSKFMDIFSNNAEYKEALYRLAAF